MDWDLGKPKETNEETMKWTQERSLMWSQLAWEPVGLVGGGGSSASSGKERLLEDLDSHALHGHPVPNHSRST